MIDWIGNKPEGFESISVENEAMIGDRLVVRMSNGYVIQINALVLADHDVGITVHKPGQWDSDAMDYFVSVQCGGQSNDDIVWVREVVTTVNHRLVKC